MEYNENYTIKDYLTKFRNKFVYILLTSGKEYLGIIKDVGQFCLILEQKGQRSYYDSIIRIDDITSVEIQVRGL
ncbi:MAG: hypothetical protein ACFFDH_21205 [Promethearchaeota archaeon]